MRFLIRIYMMGFRNADRATFVEWVQEEHYRLAKLENAMNAKKKRVDINTI